MDFISLTTYADEIEIFRIDAIESVRFTEQGDEFQVDIELQDRRITYAADNISESKQLVHFLSHHMGAIKFEFNLNDPAVEAILS